ncbi:hypothetical protein LJC49_07680 [Ruminococcaceae bacterium OttesenSCG-928-I18]|nr:hypothetical protein [Ruminococcaceae bacterium OttesenSCG-928-I18]
MSAFLGPIHLKMYDRILYQDTMSQSILDLVAKEDWSGAFAADLEDTAPAAVKQPLDTIIDKNNIHGWLSEAVALCEHRFALVVCGVLEDHPERLRQIQDTMKNLGKAHPVPSAMNAEEAYEAIHDILLDGMPCDFPFTNIAAGPGSVTWQVANCPHESYWETVGRDAEIYYRLRDAWIDGSLEQTEFKHSRPSHHHHVLVKKVRNE